MLHRVVILAVVIACGCACSLHAGPYTDPGINGYVDPNNRFRHADPLADSNAVVNPIFRGWATDVEEYAPSDDQWSGAGVWNDPTKALGPATGENFDIVSLGDLDTGEIAAGVEPGRLTLSFGQAVRNGKGYDFAVFENAFVSLIGTPAGSVAGQMLGELGYVEVSSNGTDFARFPSVSLTAGLVGPYGTIEISDVHNLAGKHPNANGLCTGTPFDLSDIADNALVLGRLVDTNDIRYVRIVDIPGSGDFSDDPTSFVDPATWPLWQNYAAAHPVYDAWVTFGSGGIDIEAVGVLNEQEYEADIDLNGVVDMFDYALFASAWGTRFGQTGWLGRCNLARTGDLVVDADDLAVLARQWLDTEKWRIHD